jgi:dynein heavy chain
LTWACNYGGRVTDGNDRVLIEVILNDIYCKDIFEDDDYKLSPSGIYYAPKHTEYEGYLDYIKALPQFPDPEVFGFHENAAITKNQNSTNTALETILLTQ